MPPRNIIVIGASAGGVGALQTLISGLPANLAAAVFVVVHIPPFKRSELPRVLEASGDLSAFHPVSGDPIEAGRIYVAPPDHHLVLWDDHVELWHGPKENLNRPAINPTFRSAAVAFTDRVIGVILTGLLEDGVAGLWLIKRLGGAAVVQDPGEAAYPDLPRSAVEHVDVDYIVPLSEIASLLVELSGSNVSEQRRVRR